MKLDEAIDVLKDFAKQVKVKSDGAYQTDKGMCACMLAIKALEKQIPKKRNSYNCPVCSHYFEDGECFTYCPECGQRLE